MKNQKGTTGHYICLWSRRTGSFSHRPVIVTACGTKRMTLKDAATGEMLGSHFNPGLNIQHQFPHRAALVASAEFIAVEIKRLESILARDGEVGSIKKELGVLQAAKPSADSYHNLVAAIKTTR
jgi:hypothetical protein